MPTPFSKKRPQSTDISEAINDLDLVVAQLGNKLDSAKQGFIFKKLSMNGETTEHGVVFQCIIKVLVLEDTWTSCPLFSDNICLRTSEVLRDGSASSTLPNNNPTPVSSSNNSVPPPNLLHERPSLPGRSMSTMLRRPNPSNSTKATPRPASPANSITSNGNNSGKTSPSPAQMLPSISTRTNKAEREKARDAAAAAAAVAAAAAAGTIPTSSPASPNIVKLSDSTIVSSPTTSTSSLNTSQPQAQPDVQPTPSTSTPLKSASGLMPLKWHFGIVGKTLAFITNVAGEYTLSLSVLVPYAHTHSDGPLTALSPSTVRAIDVPFVPKCAHNTFKFHVKEDGTLRSQWRILTDPPLLPTKAIDASRVRLSSIVLDEKISVTVGGERDRRAAAVDTAEGSLPPAERLRVEWVPMVEDLVTEGLGIRRFRREVVMGAAKVTAVEQRAQIAVAADGMRVSTVLDITMDRSGCGILMPCLLELAVADLSEPPNGNTGAEARSAVNVVKVEGEAVGHWWLAGDIKSFDQHEEEQQQAQSPGSRRSSHASPSDKSRKKLGRWHSPRLPIANGSSEDDADDETFYRDPPDIHKTPERGGGQSSILAPKPAVNLANAVSSWSTRTLMDDFTRSGVAQSGLEDSSSGESELMRANGILRRRSDSSSLGSFIGKQHPSEGDLLAFGQSGTEEDNEQAKEQEEDEKQEVEAEAEVEIEDDADTEVPLHQSPIPTIGKSLMEEIQTVTRTSKTFATDMVSSTRTAGSSFTTIYVRLDTSKLKGRGPMVSTRITVDTEMVYFVTEHDGALTHGELHGSKGLQNRLDGVLVPMVHCRVSGGDEESASVRRSGTVVVRAPRDIDVQESKRVGLHKDIDIAEALTITAPTADDRGGFETLAKRGGRPILAYRHSALMSWEDVSDDVDEEKVPRLHLNVVRHGVVDEGEKMIPIIAQGLVRVTLIDEPDSSVRRQHPEALESRKRAIVRARFDLRDPFVGDGVEHLAIRVPVPSAMVSKVFAFVDGERVDVLRSGEEEGIGYRGVGDAWKIPLSDDDTERVVGRKRTVKMVEIELGYVVAAEWVWRSVNREQTQVTEFESAKNEEEDQDERQETEGGVLVNLPLPVVLNALMELYKVDVGTVEGLECTDFEGGFSQATLPGANASVMSYDVHGSAVMTFQRQFVDPPFDSGVGNRDESLALILFMSVRKIKMHIDHNVPSVPASITDFESETPVDVKDTPPLLPAISALQSVPSQVLDIASVLNPQPMADPTPVSNEPASNEPASNELASNELASNNLASNNLASNNLASNNLASNNLVSNKLASNEPASNEPVSNEPASNEPASNEPMPSRVEKVLEKEPSAALFHFLDDYRSWLQPLAMGLGLFLLFWIAITLSISNRNNALCRSGTQIQYIPVRVVVTKENGVIFQELDRWPEVQEVGGVKSPDTSGAIPDDAGSPAGSSYRWSFAGSLWKTLEGFMKRILNDFSQVKIDADTGGEADQAVNETFTGV